MIFCAADKHNFSIKFIAENWDDAEAIAKRNEFTDVGIWIEDIPLNGPKPKLKAVE